MTVLAAESEALTQTYELMKTTSLERHAHVKQQLRCSPLELNDGPMACFVALQNVLELVGKIDCFVCHPAELSLSKGRAPPSSSSSDEQSRRRLTHQEITESVLCCVWAARRHLIPHAAAGAGPRDGPWLRAEPSERGGAAHISWRCRGSPARFAPSWGTTVSPRRWRRLLAPSRADPRREQASGGEREQLEPLVELDLRARRAHAAIAQRVRSSFSERDAEWSALHHLAGPAGRPLLARCWRLHWLQPSGACHLAPACVLLAAARHPRGRAACSVARSGDALVDEA